MQKNWSIVLVSVITLASLSVAALSFAQDRPDPRRNTGSRICLTCHGNPGITAIQQTVHGQVNVPGTPFNLGGCSECHGASAAHLQSFQSPDFVFDDGSTQFPPSGIAAQNQQCLNCHQSRERVHWAGSLHESAGLACVSCHKIHSSQASALLPEANPGLCLNCHKEKQGQFNRRSHHPVMEGLMNCTSCHNPHGSDGRALMAKSDVVATCTTCHAEKRGPFLWEHQPVSEDCTTCHNPHGSNQASMLSVRQPFMCQGCHSDAFHPSTLYSGDDIPPLGAAQQLLGASCTNCHSAIHGSNHPSGSRFTR